MNNHHTPHTAVLTGAARRPGPRRLAPLKLGALLTTLLMLALLPTAAFAAPPERPLAATYYATEGNYFSMAAEVWDSTGYMISSVTTTIDTCAAYGLATQAQYYDDYRFPLNHHIVAMAVTGTPSAAGSCTFQIAIQKTAGGTDYVTWTISIANVNEAPTNISLSNNDVDENLASGTLVGTLTSSDPDTDEGFGQSFTYSLVGGDTSSFYISGNGLRTNASFNHETKSSYNVTIRTTDQGDLSYDKAFGITVNDVNEAPTNISLSANHVTENLSTGIVVGSLSSTDPDPGNTFTYSLVGGLADNSSFSIIGNVLQTAVSFNYEAQSSYTVRVRSTDQDSSYYEKDFSIQIDNVNEAPVISNANPAPLSLLEDASASLTVSAADPELDTIVYTLVSPPDYGTATLAGNTVTYTPTANYNGSDTFQVRASDGSLWNNLTVNVTITAVNDEPSFTKGADETVNEDVGLVSRSNWATSLSRGGASDEAGQTLTFHVSNTNNALFSQQPAVGSDGTLTYRPADNAHGSATVSVYLQDSGGTANGGDDTSPTQTFDITVSPVNDAPVLDTSGSPAVTAIDEDNTTNSGMLVSALLATGTGGDPISDVDDDAAEGIGVGIAVMAVNNSDGDWQFSINGGSTWSPFGAPSTAAARLLASDADTRVRFVPNANWHGTVYSALTFRAWDQKPGSGNNGATADINATGAGFETPFSAEYELATLIVNSVNDAPILDNTGDMALDPILEDQTPNSGTSVPAIIESAGGNRITEVAYEVAPVEGLAIIGVDNTHGAWQFTTGGAWTDFGAPTESAARLLAATTSTKVRFVPDANWSMGWDDALTPTLTFRAWDQTSGSSGDTWDVVAYGGTTAFSVITETAVITVTSLNDAPTFAKGADQVLDEDAPAQEIPAWATAILAGPADEVAHGQSVHFDIIYNTAPELFTELPALSPSGTLTYTPAPDAYGEATIIFRLHDDGGTVGGGVDTSPYAFFTISINGVNDAPSFTAGADQNVDEDTGTHAIDNWATALSRGPANEDWQDLDFILGVSQPALFAAGPVISSTGQLSYTLATNANGLATITVQLHDGGGTQFGGINVSGVQTFTLTVNPINDPPVNTAVPRVNGLPFVNDTLTATTGDWNDSTDRTPGTITYAYQWQRADDEDGTNLTDIDAAIVASYTVTLADAGKYLRVRITATDDGEGTPATLSSVAFSEYTRVGVVNTEVTLSDLTRNTVEDTPLAFGANDFTANYSHTDGAPLERIRITGLPLSGTLVLDGAPVSFGQEVTATLIGQLVYTPTANWNGPDVFHWNATNDVLNAGYPLPGIGAAVTITTQAVNDEPVITLPGAFSVNEDAVSEAKVFAVADPDSPYVSPAFTGYELSLQAAHGVITLATTADLALVEGGSGTGAMGYTGTLAAIKTALNGVHYQPAAGYTGLDLIEISLADHGSDGAGEPQADARTVEVFIVEVNNPPVNTLPADFMLERDTTSSQLAASIADDARAPIQFTLSAGTGVITLSTTSNLTLLAGGNGTSLMTYRGMLARVNAALATARYRPPTGYHGPVNLTLLTNDLGNTGTGGAQTDTDVLTITVNATPLAVDDLQTTSVNVPLIVPAPGVLGNDTDADNDGLTAMLLNDPVSGTLTLGQDGAFVFTPTLNYQGTATFAYRASDAITTSLPATVTIQIDRANPDLVVAAEPAPVLLGQPATFTTTVSGFPGGATPTGAITFYADGAAIADATLASGIGVQTATTLSLGDHAITATYQGDLNYNPASTPAGASVIITNTLAAGGLVNGGVVSGTITNNGTLSDTITYTGSVVTGGIICGSTTNNGTLVDVTFCPNAIITGGVLSGTLTGTPGQPALLLDLTVAANSTLSHVIIGPGVILDPDVVLGDGVRIWLSVAVTGVGQGNIASLPPGIDCGTPPSGGGVCQAHFPYDSPVTLTPTTALDSSLAGWSGACTGQEPCVLPFDVGAAQFITATFGIRTFVITPTAGTGGSIMPDVAQTVTFGASQAFTITADSGYRILDVAADGLSVGAVGSYTFDHVTATHILTATFSPTTFPYAVDDGIVVRANSAATTIQVLANDSSRLETPLTLVAVGQPLSGTAVIDAGTVVYTPDPGIVGRDAFSYAVRNAVGLEATAWVVVVIETSPTLYLAVPVDPLTDTLFIHTSTTSATTQIFVPAGAVTSSLVLVFSDILTATFPAPGNLEVTPHHFDLTAYLDGQPQPGYRFLAPVTVTVSYTDDDIRGLQEDTLEVWYWGEAERQWQTDGITLLSRDLEGNELEIQITHLTEFAVLGQAQSYRIWLPVVVRRIYSIWLPVVRQ